MPTAKRSAPVWPWLAGALLILLIVFIGVRAFSTPSVNISEKFEAGSTPIIER